MQQQTAQTGKETISLNAEGKYILFKPLDVENPILCAVSVSQMETV